MKILGIDLGKYNSVACLFDTQTQDTLFFSFKSLASEFSALLSQSQPAQVVTRLGRLLLKSAHRVTIEAKSHG